MRTTTIVKDILRRIWLKFHERKGLNLPIENIELIRSNHPTNCLTLDLVQIPNLILKDLSQIQFSFRKKPKYKIEIQLEDRLQSLTRSFKYNKFRNSGPKMDLQNLSKNTFRYYAVKFNQNIFVEDDPGKKCRNYTKTKTSYNACDEDFIRKVLANNYPHGFLPIWATNDTSKVTSHIIAEKDNFDEFYKEIVSGTAESGCLLPCTSTDMTSVFLDEKYDSINHSRIDIAFFDTVAVTVTDLPEFSPAVFLSAFVVSMGMWLGLGVGQTLEMLVNLKWGKK